MMNKVYLLLGSNEGDSKHLMEKATQLINQNCGPVIQLSSYYQTAAWGIKEQPDFLNQVIVINTQLSPQSLLEAIQKIEKDAGRQRNIKWGQRTLDIDILFYNEAIIDNENLKIPHPFIQERRFTLAPLNEIAPNLIHPLFHKTVLQLLQECKDPLDVKKIEL